MSKPKKPAAAGKKARKSQDRQERLEETGTTCVPVLSFGDSTAQLDYGRDDFSPRDPTSTTARLRALSIQIMVNRERAPEMETGATPSPQDTPPGQSMIQALEKQHRELLAAAEAAERERNSLDLAKERDRRDALDVEVQQLREQAATIDDRIVDLVEVAVRQQP